MGYRQVGLAIFAGLRAASVVGLCGSAVVLVAAAAVALWQLDVDCGGHYSRDPRPPCYGERETWLRACAFAAGLGGLGMVTFPVVLVAAGGPRRRGMRWSRRHRAAMLQARGWLADGSITPEAYVPVADSFRRHAAGDGEGPAARAAGGCLIAIAIPLLMGAAILSASLDAMDPSYQTPYRVFAGVIAVLGFLAVSLGIPLYAWGRRAWQQAAAALDDALDGLAQLSHAKVTGKPLKTHRKALDAPGQS